MTTTFSETILRAKQVSLEDTIRQAANLHRVGPHEYAGPCPRCGGRDRFRLNTQRGWFCRRCTGEPGGGGRWLDVIDFVQFLYNVDLRNAVQRLIGDRQRMTPAEIEQISRERAERERAEAEEQRRKQAEVLYALNSQHIPERYHAALGRHGRELWYLRGLDDSWIDYYRLGYCAEHKYTLGDTLYSSPSLTIPYWEPIYTDGCVSYRCVGLQHRLLEPADPGDKYRPHLPGAGKHLFLTDVSAKRITSTVLLVEGEIKAMVTWSRLWDGDTCLSPAMSVVGTAGAAIKPDLLAAFGHCQRVYILLDPDAGKRAQAIAEMIGQQRSRIVYLPEKIDDMLNDGLITGRELLRVIHAS